MQQDFWRRVEDLYYEVLASPPESRAAVLDKSSSGDAELRREVESLIAARENAGIFCLPAFLPEDRNQFSKRRHCSRIVRDR